MLLLSTNSSLPLSNDALRPSLLLEHLRAHVMHVMDWFLKNSISINQPKTKLICFHDPHKNLTFVERLFLHSSQCLSCCCIPNNFWNSVMYLGKLFHRDISWNSHLTVECNKLCGLSCFCTMFDIYYVFRLATLLHISLFMVSSDLEYLFINTAQRLGE